MQHNCFHITEKTDFKDFFIYTFSIDLFHKYFFVGLLFIQKCYMLYFSDRTLNCLSNKNIKTYFSNLTYLAAKGNNYPAPHFFPEVPGSF